MRRFPRFLRIGAAWAALAGLPAEADLPIGASLAGTTGAQADAEPRPEAFVAVEVEAERLSPVDVLVFVIHAGAARKDGREALAVFQPLRDSIVAVLERWGGQGASWHSHRFRMDERRDRHGGAEASDETRVATGYRVTVPWARAEGLLNAVYRFAGPGIIDLAPMQENAHASADLCRRAAYEKARREAEAQAAKAGRELDGLYEIAFEAPRTESPELVYDLGPLHAGGGWHSASEGPYRLGSVSFRQSVKARAVFTLAD